MKKNILAIIIGLMVCILFTEVLIGEALWLKERQESALFYLIKNRILAHLSPQDSNRLMGSSIRFSPHPAFIADKYLGYSYQPGQYEVTLAHSTGREHSFRLTIDKDGNRITSMTPGLFEGKKEVWVFGDSFVVGWGNNDETSFPFLLQQLLIDNKVVNYAVGGYGNIQGYLQLKRLINDTSAPGRHPEYIVIGYGDYYHDRNVATPSRLRGFRYNDTPWKNVTPEKFLHPRASVDPKGRLNIEYVRLFCTQDNTACEGSDPPIDEQYRVTKKILQEIFGMGTSLGAKMVLAFIAGSDDDEAVSFASDIGYVIADIRPDPKKNEFDNFFPFDEHPGPLAQNHYAIKVAEIIKNN